MKNQKIAAWQSILRDHFFSGVVVLAPLALLFLVFQWTFGGLMEWIDQVPMPALLGEEFEHPLRGLIRFVVLFAVLVIGFASISVIGYTSKFYLGRQLWKWIGEVVERIPVFGAVYGSLEQLMRTFSSKSSKQFNRVVFVEYPRKDVWAVGFVTGASSLKGMEGHLNVFVPTVPNPTSGFHLLVKESEVRESGLKVDEAFRLILSLGMAQPQT
jgi:uncharacterized membrane protein